MAKDSKHYFHFLSFFLIALEAACSKGLRGDSAKKHKMTLVAKS
jgi:hypothetical protein